MGSGQHPLAPGAWDLITQVPSCFPGAPEGSGCSSDLTQLFGVWGAGLTLTEELPQLCPWTPALSEVGLEAERKDRLAWLPLPWEPARVPSPDRGSWV